MFDLTDMAWNWGDLFGYFFYFLKHLLFFVSLCFVISGLDDLFVDLCFMLRSLYRRWFILPRFHQPLTADRLKAHPEQYIAVMLPAWDESAVIRPMLENVGRTLNYTHFHIFVGTYPNDTDTHREVELARQGRSFIHRIVTPHDGPTNKADCLNWIYQGIRAFEKTHDIEFQIFIMQDCEDIIHPLAYKLFNYLIPRKDMIQLPVYSLPVKWSNFTGGHYIDEFAQLHYKDLPVREMINRSIPAAGVGCAFSRRALEAAAAANHNEIFSTDSLTEDYDFGLKLKALGMRQAFVKFAVPRRVERQHWLTGTRKRVEVDDIICVREYFPSSFSTAVRQKSRWVLGITLQGWESLGWQGSLGTRYMLFRDRKSLATNLINLLGYLVVFSVLIYWLIIRLYPDAYHYPPLLEQNSWLWYAVILNGCFLLHRIVLRAYCVYRLYDVKQACLSLPRMVWGNIINFFATARAIRLYARYLRTGKLIAWDKTHHVFPSEDELKAFRRKLGDLLLERNLLTVEQLELALERQLTQPQLLGELLCELGFTRQEDIKAVLGETTGS